MGFFSRLETRANKIDSLLCVGLDPHPQELERSLGENMGDRLLHFCQRIIDSTSDVAVAYKPNIAFFEAHGAVGISVLKNVIAYVPEDIPVILDAKRGDIASTAVAYAQAVFKALNADALTMNPFLGYDALEPFLSDYERGVFVLCKTSNPSAYQLQDLTLKNGKHVYEIVAKLANDWNRKGNVGVVVGATQADSLANVRNIVSDMWILAPGVGAQGAILKTALQAGLRDDGLGLLIPVSRGISQADNPGKAAEDLRIRINRERKDIMSSMHSSMIVMSNLKKSIADGLLEIGSVKFGKFELKSGLQSPIYIDLRILVGYPCLLEKIAAAYLVILKDLEFEKLAALPYGALPIATAVSILGGYAYIYPRKEVKAYGTKSEIEGVYSPEERVVVLDDLVTTGGSKFEAIEKLNNAGLYVKDIVVLIDRQSGAKDKLAKSGYQLHSVFTLTELLNYWELTNQVSKQDITKVRDFLNH